MSILFVNACVRENSRTQVLAKSIMRDMVGEITEVNLNIEDISPLDRESLKRRDGLVHAGDYDDPMFRYAMQFATADQGKAFGTGDAVAIYLKPANSPRYWELYGTPNGKITSFFVPTRGYPANPDDTVVMPGMKAVAKVQGTINNYSNKDKGWTIEFAIPLKQLKKAGADFKPGAAWTLLIARINYNYNAKDADPQYSTCPEFPSSSFNHIEYFADINWK